MMRLTWLLIFLVAIVGPASALPEIGWEAELSTNAHNVSGTVVVVDDNTLRVDDFIYDGQGINVYFYLGTENTNSAFDSGLRIGPQLVGGTFDGTQGSMQIDLPVGQTIDGWNAISGWCIDFNASFGDGVFESTVPLLGDYSGNGVIDAEDYTVWRDTLNQTGTGLAADGDGNQVVNQLDYDLWETAYNAASATTIPEPTAIVLLFTALLPVWHRKK